MGGPNAAPALALGAGAATFDAEEVMARYLAEKAAPPSDARFGAAPAPQAQPPAPPRAAFGRKGL